MLRIFRQSQSVDELLENTKTHLKEMIAVRRGRLTEKEINEMLRKLRRANSVEEATDALKALYKPLDQSSEKALRKDSAEKIARFDGVGNSLIALEKWHTQSQEFSYMTFQLLIRISFFVPTTKTFIVNSGGVLTIIEAVKAHEEGPQDDYLFKSSALGLLTNLSLEVDDIIKAEVASEECVDLVLECMKRWPEKEYAQKRGCIYFYEVGQIDEVKDLMHEKRVGVPIIDALDRFRERNKDVHKWAMQALVVYARS
mmetsp:Transcript_39375/g.95304  ORF Transcript_39375/g.95304 Transcript_39375/m.95304 type:complete len:256 (+) Transcript_39375:128-895(+)